MLLRPKFCKPCRHKIKETVLKAKRFQSKTFVIVSFQSYLHDAHLPSDLGKGTVKVVGGQGPSPHSFMFVGANPVNSRGKTASADLIMTEA